MNRHARRWLAVIAGCLSLVVTPSCAGAPDAPATAGGGSGAAEGATLRAAYWSLAWDWTAATPDEGGGWSTTNDLGYRVHLESGHLVDYTGTLALCDAADGAGGAAALGRLFHVRSARAHEGDNDSTVHLLHAEDLASPRDEGREAWAALFPADRYCGVHWLIARAPDAIDAPAGTDLEGKSLVAHGTWQREGLAGDWQVETWWPYGRIVDLAEATGEDALAGAVDGGALRVTVRRSLGGLFDGIDFEVASQDQRAGLMLENLASQATITAELSALEIP